MIADVKDVGLALRSAGADAEGVVLPAGASEGALVDEGDLLEWLYSVGAHFAADVEVFLEDGLVAVEDAYAGGHPRGALACRRVGVTGQEDVCGREIGGQIGGQARASNRAVSVVDIGGQERVGRRELHQALMDERERGLDDHRDAELAPEAPQARRRCRLALGSDMDMGSARGHRSQPLPPSSVRQR